jgi:hypothetical protein
MFKNVIAEIDRQIAQLQQAKAILGGAGGTSVTTKRRGRPAGSKNKAAGAATSKRRKLSAAGRKAIAEAQRKRWASIKAKKRS